MLMEIRDCLILALLSNAFSTVRITSRQMIGWRFWTDADGSDHSLLQGTIPALVKRLKKPNKELKEPVSEPKFQPGTFLIRQRLLVEIERGIKFWTPGLNKLDPLRHTHNWQWHPRWNSLMYDYNLARIWERNFKLNFGTIINARVVTIITNHKLYSTLYHSWYTEAPFQNHVGKSVTLDSWLQISRVIVHEGHMQSSSAY
jgi:hypothetical protein